MNFVLPVLCSTGIGATAGQKLICLFVCYSVFLCTNLLYTCMSFEFMFLVPEMTELTRPLSVRFPTRHFSRLGHEEVLTGLEECLYISKVKAIQITESACFVTLKSREAKEYLLTTGINVRDVFNNVYDVDKLITNVTIKDAPFELSDAFLLQYIKMHGDVVENSLRRGKIKGTVIETGTRYLQMVNVQNALPNIVNFGRFKVGFFFRQ